RLVAAISHSTQDGLGFFLGNRGRLVCRTTNETHDARRVFDQVPSGLVHFHLNQHIAREEFAFAFAFLAITHFHHFFSGDQNLAELFFHAGQLDALYKRAHDMLLVSRVSMHNVPTLSHWTPLTNNHGNKPTQQR